MRTTGTRNVVPHCSNGTFTAGDRLRTTVRHNCWEQCISGVWRQCGTETCGGLRFSSKTLLHEWKQAALEVWSFPGQAQTSGFLLYRSLTRSRIAHTISEVFTIHVGVKWGYTAMKSELTRSEVLLSVAALLYHSTTSRARDDKESHVEGTVRRAVHYALTTWRKIVCDLHKRRL